MPPFTSPTFETARAKVEAGDLSFEALSALTIAHGEKLIADMHCGRCGGSLAGHAFGRACQSQADVERRADALKGWRA